MTQCAQGDQVLFGIVAEQAPWLNMMDLELIHAAAVLAAPSVPLEHRSMEFLVEWGIESQPRASQSMNCHEIPLTVLRNSCCFGCGSKLKSLSRERIKAFEFPDSMFAPAKKSAQIISRT